MDHIDLLIDPRQTKPRQGPGGDEPTEIEAHAAHLGHGAYVAKRIDGSSNTPPRPELPA